MMTIRCGLVICLLAMVIPAAAADQWYRWTDSEGRLIVSRNPPRKGARISSPPPERGDGDVSTGTRSRTYEVNSRQSDAPQVELFTTSWCGYCVKARNYLRANGIAFVEYDIEKDKAAAKRKARLASSPGVPFAIINGRGITGFSEAAYERALRGP